VDGRTYGDLEGGGDRQLPLFKKLTKREMLEVMRLQAEAQKQLIKLLEQYQQLSRPGGDDERHLREVARRAVQEELFEREAEKVARKKADEPERMPVRALPRIEFEPKLRDALRLLRDPAEFDKLTNANAAGRMFMSPNTLWGHLKDYGYVRAGETMAKCLRRLADEWQSVQNLHASER
jgi:predicted DNA-binding protein (UPF0251 family)